MLRMVAARSVSRQSDPRGQAIVETALILPLVLFLLLAAVDFGIAYSRQVQISSAVRSAGRFATLYPTYYDSTANADPDNIKYHVKREATSFTLSDSNVSIYYEVYGTNPPTSYAASASTTQYAVSGNFVRVTVTYTYTPLSFYLNVIAPAGTFTLGSTAVMQIE